MSTLNVFQSKKKTSFQATNQRSVVPNQPIVTRPYSKLQLKSLDSFQLDGNIYQTNRTIKNKPNNSLLSLTSILCFTVHMENAPLDSMLFQSSQHSADNRRNTEPDEDNTLSGIFNEDVSKAIQLEKKERKPLRYSSAIACERLLLKYPDNLMYLLLQMVLTPEIYCQPFPNEEHRKPLSEESLLAKFVKCNLNEYVGRVVMFSLTIKHQNGFFDKSNNCRDLAGEKQHKRNNSPSGEARLKDTADDIQKSQPPNIFTKEQRAMLIYYVFFQCLTFSLYYGHQALDQLDTDTVATMKPFSLYIVQFGLLLFFIYIKWLFKSPSSLKDS
ncbi:Hypothetical predicted protein [Octopus vulgaris]|uniref:Uncharacterized protein n=1 Tax=Octopus vulgaris TaxID=6645 RepID=A0AA36FDB3_OCTVU|nr:Hypothetical predicted protein [Octopus vulgaris]